jgi:hypothetical protein
MRRPPRLLHAGGAESTERMCTLGGLSPPMSASDPLRRFAEGLKMALSRRKAPSTRMSAFHPLQTFSRGATYELQE